MTKDATINPNPRTASPVLWPAGGVHAKLEPLDIARFEYAVTENARKQESNPPDGGGWEEIDWQRFDYTEEVLWRRPRGAA